MHAGAEKHMAEMKNVIYDQKINSATLTARVIRILSMVDICLLSINLLQHIQGTVLNIKTCAHG